MKRSFLLIICILFAATSSSLISQVNKVKDEIKSDINKLDGFGDLKWGTNISDAKGKVIGKIVFYDEMKLIVTRDGNIEYLYGFFFMDPEIYKLEEASSVKKDEKIEDVGKKAYDVRLFYVSLRFPYLTMKEVRKKVENKYGQATGENIKDNQGAIIWDFDKTTIIMWIDRYEDRPYCRKINYIGKELATDINEYQKRIFNKIEIEILKKLSL